MLPTRLSRLMLALPAWVGGGLGELWLGGGLGGLDGVGGGFGVWLAGGLGGVHGWLLGWWLGTEAACRTVQTCLLNMDCGFVAVIHALRLSACLACCC